MSRTKAALGPIMVQPPLLQPAGLYLELLGEDLRSRAFLVSGSEGEELCLRPDMTVPAVREALKLNAWEAPFAVSYDGLVFRRQPANSLRETEFRQAGEERFAPAQATAEDEAAVILAALATVREAGVAPRLRLGDVALFDAMLTACGLSEAWRGKMLRAFGRPGGIASVFAEARKPAPEDSGSALAAAAAALPGELMTALLEEMLSERGIANVGGRPMSEIIGRLRARGDAAAVERPQENVLARIEKAIAIEARPDVALEALAEMFGREDAAFGAALKAAHQRWMRVAQAAEGIEALFSLGFGRGLGFYDGFVFELEALALGDRASLGGGGRYDGLLHRIAGSEAPQKTGLASWGAIGFALRPERIMEAKR